MSNRLCLNDVLIPEHHILDADDKTLKDCIAKLEKFLEQGDLPLDDIVRIKYHQKLYAKFTKENEVSMQLDNILSGIKYENSECIAQSRKEFDHEGEVVPNVRDLAVQTESEPYVLSWSVMKSLSRQIYHELMERFGSPTVVAVGKEFSSFGTMSCKILMFDLKQKLVGVLDPPLREFVFLIKIEFPVSSLGISYSQQLIVSGHESGHIFIWDRSNKSVIKAIPPIPSHIFQEGLDGHLASSAIIHITFVGQKDKFISADDMGSAFYHEINQLIFMYSISSTRIHNHPHDHSRATTIYNIKALPSRYLNSDCMRMVAITTPYKLIIMNMKPSPWIVFRYFWGSDGQYESKTVTSSCISWLPIRKGRLSLFILGEFKLPKLAVSFGSKIIVFDIFYSQDFLGSNMQSEISMTIHKECMIGETIVFMEWINEALLLCLTNRSMAVFIDPLKGKYLEQASVDRLALAATNCFSNKHSKLNITCEKSYHQKIVIFKKMLFCLGTDQTLIAGLVSWTNRLYYLMDHNDYIKALRMAETFYEGKMLYAVTGVPEHQEDREETIGRFMESMIFKYINHLNGVLYQKCQSDVKQIANILFSTANKIGNPQLIFEQIHRLFSDSKLLPIFVSFYDIQTKNDFLEASILNGDLTSISSPSIMHDLQEHFVSQQLYKKLENILCKLDLKVFNTDSILLLCSKHLLFKAMIRIYNLCLNEYITPTCEIVKLLQSSCKTTDSSWAAGIEILFEYLESCLSKSIDGVPEACAKFLFSANPIQGSSGGSILKTLTDFNLKKSLWICEICLDLPSSTLDKSYIVEYLLNLSFSGDSEAEINIFASKMIIKHAISFPPESVKYLIIKLSNSTVSSDAFWSEHLQDSVISLIYSFIEVNVDIEDFKKINFWKVVEFLARKEHKYDLIMEGMIRNPFARNSLLEDLDLLWSLSSLKDIATLTDVLYRELETLVSFNIKICNLVSTFHLDHNYCLSLLSPNSQFLYLSELFSDSNYINLEFYDKYLELLCQFEPLKLKAQLLQSFHSFTFETLLKHTQSYKILDAYLYLEPDPHVCLGFLRACNISPEYLEPVLEFCKNHSSTLNLQDFYASLLTNLVSDEHLNLLLSAIPLRTCLSLPLKAPHLLYKIQNHCNSTEMLKSTLQILQEETILDMESLVKLKRRATLNSKMY